MSELKNIIFDFDGVIADSWELIYKLSKDCDPSMTTETFIEHSCWNVFQEAKIDYLTKWVDYFFDNYNKELSVTHLQKSLDTITLLWKKYNLYIISSNIEQAINRVLKKAWIIDLFGAVLWYESHRSKVEKFKMLEKEFWISNTDSIFITDTLWDIKEANELWYRTIAETFWIHNRELLAEGNPYSIVDNWEEFISEIKKI